MRCALNCRDVHSPRSIIAAILSLAILTGCAPRDFDRAITYYADRENIRDAAARRTDAAWFLRFDTDAIYDLDAAISSPDASQARKIAAELLQRADALAIRSICDELSRLSPASVAELARRADCPASAAALTAVVEARARAALATELAADDAMSDQAWRRRMREIREGVEPLPDDRDRALRQVLLAGFSPAVAVGIEEKEKEVVAAVRDRNEKGLPRAAIWNPFSHAGDVIARWAPRIAVEWPSSRDYPDDYDRIGAVSLSGTRDAIRVSVDPARATIYAYQSTAQIYGRRCPQLNYVWWFSDRPPMTADDAAAGHIDGGTLRLTLDPSGQPAIAEIILNCGCGHEVYVAEDIEAAARNEFGPPIAGARFSCEAGEKNRRPILVADTYDRSAAAARPVILLAAGTHEPVRFDLRSDLAAAIDRVIESRDCAIADYDTLDRLPLGDGVASMFGPDGLVHFAGRREGFLLAPSGMLSAGQPRKRGTQRIRWDEYLFDDPTLLERTLRLPTEPWRRASPATRPIRPSS